MRGFFVRLMVIGLLISNLLVASEFRSPWFSERGPIRYIWEKSDKDKCDFNVYSLAHRRESSKAFLKHGIDTQPLTALFFNKADIPLNEIFPDNQMDPNSEYYNPYMELRVIKPRATYYEWGANIGARLDYKVKGDKGKIGFRVNVPVRSIEIEREDVITDKGGPEDEYILKVYTRVGNFGYRANAVGGVAGRRGYKDPVEVLARAYNLDFISKLFQDHSRNSALQFGNRSVKVFGTEIAKNFHANDISFRALIEPVAGIIKGPIPELPNFDKWGYTPGNIDNITVGFDIAGQGGDGGYGVRDGDNNDIIPVEARHNWAFDAGDGVRIAGDSLRAHKISHDIDEFPNIDRAVQIMKAPNIAFFDDHEDYSEFMDAGYPTNMPDYLKNSWLVLGYNDGALVPGAMNIKNGIEDAVKLYEERPSEWLQNRGFEFETSRRTGLGDIDLDFFYENRFSDKLITEFMIGLRLPTGVSSNYSGNAYNANLGNGEHWEVKLGGMAAWQAVDWMNIKLDSYVSFVLDGTESRCAVFEGSSIKNIGPKVDADVDWRYLVTRLDATIFHPKTNDISGTIGYEFYWKGEDNIHYKLTEMTPFSGPHYEDDSNLLKKPLSNQLAAANTEAFAHKLRYETRVKVNKWFEFFCGGAFTFAGKNVPREFDAHAGFVVDF